MAVWFYVDMRWHVPLWLDVAVWLSNVCCLVLCISVAVYGRELERAVAVFLGGVFYGLGEFLSIPAHSLHRGKEDRPD